MAVALVQEEYTVTGGNTNLTTHSVPLPSSPTENNLLLAILSCDGNPTWTPPAGWTEVYDSNPTDDPNMLCGMWVGWRLAAASEPATEDWVLSSAETMTFWVGEFSGFDASTPIDAWGYRNDDPPGNTTAVTGATVESLTDGAFCMTGVVIDTLYTHTIDSVGTLTIKGSPYMRGGGTSSANSLVFMYGGLQATAGETTYDWSRSSATLDVKAFTLYVREDGASPPAVGGAGPHANALSIGIGVGMFS